jgi:ubiquinone/menaquinone biosynthesis C-methylase UbiE
MINAYRPPGNDLEILDAGCGPGFFAVLLSQEGHKVTAVDYTPQMIEQTTLNTQHFGVSNNVNILRQNIQEMDFDDNVFDMVISRNVTWTLDDPAKAYSEWLRVLKPGGCFLNFDSNFLFSLYDEELQKQYHEDEKEAIAMGYVPEPNDHLADGMDKVLPNLVSAKNSRPEWDLNTLVGLECRKITLDKTAFKGMEKGYRAILDRTNRMFMIRAEK